MEAYSVYFNEILHAKVSVNLCTFVGSIRERDTVAVFDEGGMPTHGLVQSFADDICFRFRQSISHNPFYDMLAARKKKAQKTNVHSKS